MLRNVLICLALLLATLRAEAILRGSAAITGPRSELVLNGMNTATEFPLLNLMKQGVLFGYGDNSGRLKPDELDANGYPLSGGAWASKSGALTLIPTPSQAERPGHYVFVWTGAGKFNVHINSGGSSSSVSCTGTVSFSAGPICDSTACSSFTASLSSMTLTVTSAPTGSGCTLGAGVPISGAGVKVSTFGTPTIITSAGSACGGNTCYTVNQSQSVGSESMQMGGRFELSSTDTTTTNSAWNVIELATTGGNYATNFALYHIGDEASWWASGTPCGSGQGCIVGSLFKTRINQGNFAVLRDLNWALGNISNCTTWASRKPVNYVTYAGDEMRNAASGPGLYVNAGGTGASGGTVTYNAGTDTYSITLGSGGPVDKQTILLLAPSTGTTSSKISLNGTTAVPVLSGYGLPLANGFGQFIPTSGIITSLVYDATLGGYLSFGGSAIGDLGLSCGIPPEAFVEINAELGTTPWHVPGSMSLDPMTDWVRQYATYIKANYASVKPIFEGTNEPWNSGPGPYDCIYLSAKSAVYIAQDSAWTSGMFCGSAGNINSEVGKIVSTMGQDLLSVYGAGNYELLSPVQTGFVFTGTGPFADALTSSAYVNQTVAPTQSGYTKTPAYQYATRISVNNYWNTGDFQAGAEVGLAYCYYNYSISSACQSSYGSQAAVMTALMATSNTVPNNFSLAFLRTLYAQWKTFGANCGLASRPGGCTVSQTTPLMFYEGGYNEQSITANVAGYSNSSGDILQSIGNATNATNAVLTIPNNGCVAGQAVTLAGLTGGTWSSANGNYTVVSATQNTCTVNLNSTGLGTFGSLTIAATASWSVGAGTISVGSCTSIVSGQSIFDTTTGNPIGQVRSFAPCSGGVIALEVAAANAGSSGDSLLFSSSSLTYPGSNNYVNYLRAASYLAPELDTLTTQAYGDVLAGGGINPSQYQLASGGGGNPWLVWAFDIYGYFTLGQCSSCTISGSTLTLGGTITGAFRVGDTLFGAGVTGLGTGAGSNTTITSCTRVGSGPCGSNPSDTLGLSQASTVASGTAMTGNATPPANNAGTSTTSPARSWGAICRFNGNGAQCNG